MYHRFLIGSLCLVMLSTGRAMAAEPDLEGLIAALRSPDERLRVRAVDELGRLGPQAAPAVPALVRAIADPEPAVRRKAVEALGRLRPDPEVTVGPFVRLMEDSEPSVRLRALDALAEYGEAAVPALVGLLETDRAAYWACLVLNEIGPDAEAAVPALAERVSDPRAEVRREAILALAEIGEAAAPAVDAITAAMADEVDRIPATYALGRIGQLPPKAESWVRENAHAPDPLLRTVSVWALARVHPEDGQLQEEAIKRLVESLKSEAPQARAAAARALAALEPDPDIAGPILEDALRTADEQTVAHALDAMAALGPTMVPQLTAALRFEALRPRIVFLLGEMGADAEHAVETLVELIDDPNRRVQHEALVALAKIGPAARAAVPALTVTLREREGPCKYGAAFALGRIGPDAEAAKPELLKTTGSQDDTLALLSAWALAQIDPGCVQCAPRTVPVLVRGLEHPEANHRREAAAALGSLGPLAESAVPALEQAVGDPDVGVRAAVTAALEAIDQT